MLRPREGRFSLDLMRFGDELVDAREIDLPNVKGGKGAKAASPKELHLALGLIDQLTAKSFDPSKHPDEYRSAVTALVEKKVRAGEELAGDERDERAMARGAANEQRGGKVIDLADILQRSLRRAKSPVAKRSTTAMHPSHPSHPKKAARSRKAS
jgi:non-homologous end joining protein Ku